jgi:hypothetical protein
MGAWDDLVGFGTALGNGVVSVAKDMYFGAERTAEGLGVRGYDRTAAIGLENEFLVKNLVDLVRGVVTAQDNPLYQLVVDILEKYYEWFPDDALEKVAKAASISTGYVGGRMLIGRQLAVAIAIRIVTQIAATEAYKELAKKIGVSAAAGSTGVGTLITLVMVQGVGQRASRASQRLRGRNPTLWQNLRSKRGRDMLYFLVEGPMANYIDAIDLACRNRPLFEQEVRKLYQ